MKTDKFSAIIDGRYFREGADKIEFAVGGTEKLKMKTIVIDLDGTLANIDHRLPFIKRESPDWDSFYSACDGDKVNEWCKILMENLNVSDIFITIVSGRRKAEENKTKEWLMDNSVSYDSLNLLREDGDFTPDTELKKKWLHEYGHENILFVVDDRQKVVDMWRKEGVVCLQCYQWEEYKRKKEEK